MRSFFLVLLVVGVVVGVAFVVVVGSWRGGRSGGFGS